MALDKRIAIIAALCAAAILLFVYFTPQQNGQQQNNNANGGLQQGNTTLANPASVYCEEHGGKLKIVTAKDGSQSGVCILKDGTECDEWAYFRGECPKGDEPSGEANGSNGTAQNGSSNVTGGMGANGGGQLPNMNQTPPLNFTNYTNPNNATNFTNYTTIFPPDGNETDNPPNNVSLNEEDFLVMDDSMPNLLNGQEIPGLPPMKAE